MKTNKKAILGFAVAMVFSLAFMQGNSVKNTNQDMSVQQVSLGAGYMAGSTEGGTAGAWAAGSAMAGAAAGQVATGGTLLGWTPVGWGMWAGAGALAL